MATPNYAQLKKSFGPQSTLGRMVGMGHTGQGFTGTRQNIAQGEEWMRNQALAGQRPEAQAGRFFPADELGTGGDVGTGGYTGGYTAAGGGNFTPEQLAEHWRTNPGSIEDAMNANPEAWGADGGWGANIGTGDGGSGWQQDPMDDYSGGYFEGDVNPGDIQVAWNEGYGWLNTARDAVLGINQDIIGEIGDTRTDLTDIANQGYYDKTGQFRNWMDAASGGLEEDQAGIEKALTQSNIAATIGLQGGEESALRTLEDYTGEGVGALNPYAQAGVSAQQRAAALSGALGPEAEAQARASESESPYQQYLRDQAQKEILQNASATGGLGGANVLTALQDRSMALSGQFEQERMANLMALGEQGLGAAGQQAGLYGQAGQTGAGVNERTAAQLSANQMAMGQSLSQSRANLSTGIADIAKMRGISEREMAAELESSLNAIVSQTGAAQVAALQALASSMQGFGQSGVDFIANLNAAIRSASPGANSSAGYANAAASVMASVLGNLSGD